MRWQKTYNWRPSSLETRFSKNSPTVATISYPAATTPTATKRKGFLSASGPDALLSWKVAFSCFVFNVVTIGMFKANAIVFVEYLKISGLSREIASWPFSIAGLSVIFVGPFVGVLSRYLSSRTLCLFGAFANFMGLFVSYFRTDILFMIVFFGLVRGVGLAIVVCLVPVFLNQYFQRHRATAQGIVGAGSPLGLMACSFLIEFGVEKYALSGTMLLLAGVSLHAFAASMPLHRAPWLRIKKPIPDGSDNPAFVQDQPVNGNVDTCNPSSTKYGPTTFVLEDQPVNGNVDTINPPSKTTGPTTSVQNSKDIVGHSKGGSKSVLREFLAALMNCRFVMISLTFVTVTNAGLVFTIIVVDYAIDLGFTRAEGVYMLLAFSVGDIVGKLGLGWVTDKKFLSLQSYFALTVSISGGIFIGIPYVQPMFLVCTAAFFASGVLQGSALSLITLFYLEYLRKDQVPMAFSLYVSLAGLSSITRPPLIGLFRDRMGSYDNLLRAIGGTLILAAVVWALDRIVNRVRR